MIFWNEKIRFLIGMLYLNNKFAESSYIICTRIYFIFKIIIWIEEILILSTS